MCAGVLLLGALLVIASTIHTRWKASQRAKRIDEDTEEREGQTETEAHTQAQTETQTQADTQTQTQAQTTTTTAQSRNTTPTKQRPQTQTHTPSHTPTHTPTKPTNSRPSSTTFGLSAEDTLPIITEMGQESDISNIATLSSFVPVSGAGLQASSAEDNEAKIEADAKVAQKQSGGERANAFLDRQRVAREFQVVSNQVHFRDLTFRLVNLVALVLLVVENIQLMAFPAGARIPIGSTLHIGNFLSAFLLRIGRGQEWSPETAGTYTTHMSVFIVLFSLSAFAALVWFLLWWNLRQQCSLRTCRSPRLERALLSLCQLTFPLLVRLRSLSVSLFFSAFVSCSLLRSYSVVLLFCCAGQPVFPADRGLADVAMGMHLPHRPQTILRRRT